MRGVLADAPDHAAGTKQTYVNDMQAKWQKRSKVGSFYSSREDRRYD